jgi:antirestriction factor ArdC-like protein
MAERHQGRPGGQRGQAGREQSTSTSHRTRRTPTSHAERQPSLLPDATQLLTQLNDSLHELTTELSQGKSERLQQYLTFASRFHHYSRANQWLIQAQLPTATRVASYKKWQEEGYQVAKGEKGIRILAPSIRKIRHEAGSSQHEPGDHEDQEAVEEANSDKHATDSTPKTIVRFVAVSVFDVSQLTPEKRPPEFFSPLAGDADAFNERLVEAATIDGFTVEQTEYTRGAEGYSQGRRIITRTDLTSMNRALTTLHEYAHGLLHQGVHTLGEQLSTRRNLTQISVPLKECHAEATAYVVAKHFNLPTPFSADYLLQWGTKPEILRGELDVVLAAASHIIGTIEGEAGSEPA